MSNNIPVVVWTEASDSSFFTDVLGEAIEEKREEFLESFENRNGYDASWPALKSAILHHLERRIEDWIEDADRAVSDFKPMDDRHYTQAESQLELMPPVRLDRQPVRLPDLANVPF